ncbi:SDR family oxidoreductase [Puia dinghuensis]|uniref:Short-chain dehydrogenase n=1 Tax=Puia dinghuensis TaxID=1792502 RepID=A0A8J2UH82_9BACT|nr:SDR family oxidoreductase [Puia dinghuensis]GGB16485.1 short-chain dehydrogenase [Puia dinghuensis]
MPSLLLLGATSDMATALARKFASTGYDVLLAARNTHRLEPLRSDLAIRYGITASLLEFDARGFDYHAAFWEALPVKPDLTICVFGYLGEEAIAESDWAECRNILEVNYVGAVSILNIVANDYITRGKGAIVGISSVAGERGRQSNYLYGSAKAGFTAYLSGLRNRLFHHGLHVLTVKPGFVYTRMTEGLTLRPLLTATPEQVATSVWKAVEKKKNVVYVKWFWRWIMLIIKSIPEFLFKKLKM